MSSGQDVARTKLLDPNPTTVVAAETHVAAGPSQSLPSPPTTSSPAVPPVHAGCNGSHLAVGALGVMNGVEHRDRRRANFLTRALSVEHPAVLPTAHSFSHGPTFSSYHILACCASGARGMHDRRGVWNKTARSAVGATSTGGVGRYVKCDLRK